MSQIVKTKVICAGKLGKYAGEVHIVTDSLTKLTNHIHYEQLREISKDFTIYTWWCNLPVYDCKIANQFLNWINFSNNNLEIFCWNIFDDMTYNFFCILFDNYELKIINNCSHSLEFANTDLVQYTNENLTKLYWVNNRAYSQNPAYYHNNNFLIVFHSDRF